ncbi:oplophorus-luciferin 2-monooxygenase non-catalytic subunit-like [Penaeus japonicus]|uniref:oplophorus-luciferin 2-monooxygenase non-catalytic subunit-like n=1 Tax=Penaeus japonicus TaxID=27405 RepID=UPI001C714887|nr:oplophorus-luciferin 2-monooxygenase non-catalytic subunit-like [Penaeus japonicus]
MRQRSDHQFNNFPQRGQHQAHSLSSGGTYLELVASISSHSTLQRPRSNMCTMHPLVHLSFALLILGAAASSKTSWPCPEPEEIAPCLCTTHPDTGQISMDCSEVQNDGQLSRAFRANFPFFDLDDFTMIKSLSEEPINVTRLTPNTFGNVSFTNIAISNTNLNSIDDLAFSRSFATMQTLTVSYSKLTSFPFDILKNCFSLKDLRVFNNRITHMSNIHSDSLEYLQVSHNPELHYNDDTFKTAPNLKVILMNNIDLQYIAPDTFAAQSGLEILDLSENKITELVPDSLRFTSDAMKEIKLQRNHIEKIDQSSISGLTGNVYLWLQHNRLTEIPEKVWQPVFDSVAGTAETDLIVFDDNPIRCDCNIKWLISSTTYMDIIGNNAACDDGTFLNDGTLGDFILQHC